MNVVLSVEYNNIIWYGKCKVFGWLSEWCAKNPISFIPPSFAAPMSFSSPDAFKHVFLMSENDFCKEGETPKEKFKKIKLDLFRRSGWKFSSGKFQNGDHDVWHVLITSVHVEIHFPKGLRPQIVILNVRQLVQPMSTFELWRDAVHVLWGPVI